MLFVSTLLGCASKKENEVVLFNDLTFRLLEGEQVVGIDAEKEAGFHSHFKISDVQVPLFKCITSKAYTIYLGVPFNTNIKKLSDPNLLAHADNGSSFEGDSTSYFHIRYQHEDAYCTAYAKKIDDNLIYILTTTTSRELSDSLFSTTMLSTRMNP